MRQENSFLYTHLLILIHDQELYYVLEAELKGLGTIFEVSFQLHLSLLKLKI